MIYSSTEHLASVMHRTEKAKIDPITTMSFGSFSGIACVVHVEVATSTTL
jgi:hypothetical protein